MNINASGGKSKWKQCSVEGRKEGRKDERKKRMRAVHSEQHWQPEQGAKPHCKAASCKAGCLSPPPPPVPHVSHNWRGDYTLGKEAGRNRLTLTNPKLIPQQTFPIHYSHLFFINQTLQTQRLEHSGSAYPKHRDINMETTDPRRITG